MRRGTEPVHQRTSEQAAELERRGVPPEPASSTIDRVEVPRGQRRDECDRGRIRIGERDGRRCFDRRPPGVVLVGEPGDLGASSGVLLRWYMGEQPQPGRELEPRMEDEGVGGGFAGQGQARPRLADRLRVDVVHAAQRRTSSSLEVNSKRLLRS